jgi:hypothetical protein
MGGAERHRRRVAAIDRGNHRAVRRPLGELECGAHQRSTEPASAVARMDGNEQLVTSGTGGHQPRHPDEPIVDEGADGTEVGRVGQTGPPARRRLRQGRRPEPTGLTGHGCAQLPEGSLVTVDEDSKRGSHGPIVTIDDCRAMSGA